jgi:preprotein translocase subunit SecG
LEIALTVLHVLLSVGLIAVILLQSGKSAGLSGSIAGGAETLLGKKKGLDEFLAKITMVLGAAFGIIALVLAVVFR